MVGDLLCGFQFERNLNGGQIASEEAESFTPQIAPIHYNSTHILTGNFFDKSLNIGDQILSGRSV